LSFNTSHVREARTQALRFVSLLLEHGSFAEVSRLAAAVARDKDDFQLWVEAVGAVLQDVYYARVAPARIGQHDIVEDLTRLAERSPKGAVVSAISGLKRLKAGLTFNLNRQLAVESLFLSELKNSQPRTTA